MIFSGDLDVFFQGHRNGLFLAYYLNEMVDSDQTSMESYNNWRRG